MRALLSGVIAMIEAVAVAIATLLGIAALALLIWWLSFGLAAEPLLVFQGVGAVWLLAHFVPITLDVSAEAMQSLGFAPEHLSFVLSLAPLGITLVTVAFAARAGWRFGSRGGVGAAGTLGGALGFGAIGGALAAFIALERTIISTSIPVWAVSLICAAAYGTVSLSAFFVRAAREHHAWWERMWVRIGIWGREGALSAALTGRETFSVHEFRQRASALLRLAVMLFAGFVAIAAFGFALSVLLGYAKVTAATQALQLDIWGIVMLFLLQLALLPTLIAWSGAWITGAGFSIGIGSSVSPFGALLGPVPAVPAFAAIPEGWGPVAVLAPFALALLGLSCGVVYGRICRGSGQSVATLVVTAVLASVIAGLAVSGITWAASGAIGPGRLAGVGAEVWITGGLAAGELAVGTLLGAFAGRADLARFGSAVKQAVPSALLSGGSAPKGAPGDAANILSSTEVSWARDSLQPVGGDVSPDDQLTEPLEPLSPVGVETIRDESADRDGSSKFAETDPSSASGDPAPPAPIALPTARDTPIDGDSVTDIIDTDVVDTDVVDTGAFRGSSSDDAVVSPDSELGLRQEAPELFDQAEALDDQGGLGGTDAAAKLDPLLDAFAWDAPQPEPEIAVKKRGIRFPRKKR